MKKIKKIGLICLVINIFLVLQLFCGSINALNNSNEEPEIIEISTNEILPMMASNCSISLAENDAINYAINFLGPNVYTDPTTGYSRSNTADGFKQVRLDLNGASPHINCEIFVNKAGGGYNQTYNMHVYII